MLGVYVVIVTESPRVLGLMVVTLLAIGTLHAGIALAQVAHNSALGLTQLGELSKGAFGYSGIGGRGYGLGFNPNPVGMILAAVSMLAYGLFVFGGSSSFTRYVILAIFLITSIGLLATLSRSALMGWILAILLVSFLVWLAGTIPRRTTVMRVFAVAVLLLLLLGVARFAATIGVADRFGFPRLPVSATRSIF